VDPLVQLMERSASPAGGGTIENAVLALLLSFVLGHLIGWTYVATHTGLSYSRSFTQSLVLLTMIVSVVMLVIGNNIVTAFGLIGALAIIRFRNVLKDTRDTVFVFLALVVGMAIGSEKYVTGIVATVAIVLAVLYLHYTAFGSLGRFDGHLSFLVAGGEGDDADATAQQAGPADDGGFASVLRRFCRSFKEVSVRQSGSTQISEFIFEVRLRDRGRSQEMIDELLGTPGVQDVSLVLRDELSEV